MKYNLIYYGNETLRQKADKVTNITQDTVDLIDQMYNIMYKYKGIGLAAPQVDVSQRILVLDIEHVDGPSMTLINPVIKEVSEFTEPFEEGCLSLPSLSADVIRPETILVNALTPEEKEVTFEASGLLARVIQHEIDHLNGVLFIDHLEDFLRNEMRSDLKKIKKLNRV